MQGKWISDLTAETPVADAARRVLTFRLESVRDCLGQALREEKQLSERVHELRVSTRRAAAALSVFSECLPAKVYKSARRQLRNLRRAAGEARDWDVFIARLLKEAGEPTPQDGGGIDMLIGYAMAHRIPAQTRLELASPNYPFGFERFMATVVGAIRYKGIGKAGLADFARPHLAAMLDELNEAAAGERGNDYRRLHDVRIAGKRLRYAMEIFVDCFGPALRRQICPALAELQQILGDVNDHFTVVQRYTVLDEKLRLCLPRGAHRYLPVIARLIQYHESELPVGRRRYHDWRERWQQDEIQQAIAEVCRPAPVGCHPAFTHDDPRPVEVRTNITNIDTCSEPAAERIA